MMPPGAGLPGLSVRRPLLAAVMNLLIVIAGLAAMLGVEVRELPDVDRPIVSVRANLPGAAPETMDAEVTSILEGAISRVSGVREINSSSEENNSRIRIEFNPGVDLDTAASDVREAVSRVTRELPDRVENVAVTKADSEGEAVLTIAVISTAYSEEELSRIITNDIIPEFLSIEGIATIQEFGTRERQMRVVVDPLRLSRFGLTIADVASALREAPFDVPVGSFRSESQELIVRAEATAATPELIKDIYIRGDTKIGDVAEAVLGPADADDFLRYNGNPIIGLGVVRQAQSNTIQISSAAKKKIEQLNRRFDDIRLEVTSDEAVFIEKSVEEVLLSLAITVLIVVGTIWLFLGSAKATIIPAVAIPVSLIGTVAGIWVLGFSINLLTLLALVLATGLIVDDAIVVLENIQRKQADGLRRRAAAVIGGQQVFFAVIATTAVLIAVFVPISFLPSTTGRLFREFGFVMSLSVGISSIVALTLAPAIASKFRFIERDPADRKDNALERFGRLLLGGYERALRFNLDRPMVIVIVSLLAAIGAGLLYRSLSQELVPPEDRGVVQVFATGPDGVGLAYMEQEADEIEALLQPFVDDGTIENLFTIVGAWDPNRVNVTARLAPWEERELSQQDVISALQGPMSEIPGSRVSVFGRSSLSVGWGGRGGGLRIALTGNNYDDIYAAARSLARAVDSSDILSNADISYQPTQPQLSVQVDRRRAADLNVPLDQISVTLRAMVDGEDLIDLNVEDQAIPIILESETGAIRDPGDLRNLFVRSDEGALVPISTLTEIREEGVAAELDRTAQRRAIEVDMDIAPGLPLADAIAEIERLGDEALPAGINMILQGDAATLEESNRDLLITYGFAFIIVLLVLVAQFESVTSPLVILLSVPFALAAAVYALTFTGVSLNIYSQIGLIMLIGLMAKNGILLVEFADQLRSMGRSVKDAVFEAAIIRARPIVMTLISTVLGALPLILSSGAGAEARNSIGWVVFGGLGLAALFTLFLTPVIYLGVARLSKPRTQETRALEEELEEARAQQGGQLAE
ncbi:efflux RND transporter permease subunit [Henriciella mobilis]|uniref:efflux RND transporter permease subunit n=1 Tax=Henriciella mobilis TaxID=2305467 RepID=UPI000E666C30|nr:efflux RND transporter permease subunit [Henriciella mobilis]RIJ16788.1 efflux RND transporter permease subunit [Henriciella mobilis]RIJ19477.1 efflux RND transporter permease subunit [Henriciella mobilis]